MRRRTFLHGIVGTAVVGAGACANSSGAGDDGGSAPTTTSSRSTSSLGAPTQPQPNLIVIYLDDMRLDGLDFMPRSRAHFDHEFTQARANGGACTDTRMGLFTGTYILNHPWNVWRTQTDRDPAKTWGSWMHSAGYRTGMFGKYISTEGWQFGAEEGWDVWRSYVRFAHSDEGFEIDLGTTPLEPVTPEGRNLDYMVDELIEFSLTSTDRPFFASWNPQHPHVNTEGWFNIPLERVDAWPDLPSPVPVDEDITGKPAWVRALDPITPQMEADLRRAYRGQAQALSGVDDAIDRLFIALRNAGRLDDTIVVLSSDQGVHYGEHRWGSAYGVTPGVQKGTLYEPVVRVPMLATGPGFAPGVTTAPATQADITAMAVAVAGAIPSHELDGIDLRAIADNPEAHSQRVLLLQSVVPFSPVPDHESVVTGPEHAEFPLTKLGRLTTGEVEVYDLVADPGEFINLADEPEHRATRDALESILDEILAT